MPGFGQVQDSWRYQYLLARYAWQIGCQRPRTDVIGVPVICIWPSNVAGFLKLLRMPCCLEGFLAEEKIFPGSEQHGTNVLFAISAWGNNQRPKSDDPDALRVYTRFGNPTQLWKVACLSKIYLLNTIATLDCQRVIRTDSPSMLAICISISYSYIYIHIYMVQWSVILPPPLVVG